MKNSLLELPLIATTITMTGLLTSCGSETELTPTSVQSAYVKVAY